MDSYTLILFGIIILLVLLLGTVCVLIVYSGLLHDIEVGVGEPVSPLNEGFVGFYKFDTGSYKNASFIFSEACSLVPQLKTFGIYYDDSKEVKPDELRWIAGSVIPKSLVDTEEMKEAQLALEENGFKKFEFPAVTSVVKAQFPFKSDLSIIFGSFRVCPQIEHFIQEHRLNAYPFLEYYGDNNIHYYAPLEKHDDFFVPEVEKRTAL